MADKPLSPAPEICPLHYVPVAEGEYKDYAPFSYRQASRAEVIEIQGVAGGWGQWWGVVDSKNRIYLIRKSENSARNGSEALNYEAAKEIMAGSNPQT